MELIKCKECEYSVLQLNSGTKEQIYPYLRDSNGTKEMWSVSPTHGRSYVVGKTMTDRHIVSKGNGLSYSQYSFINTREIGDETLGLLLRKDALRDFDMGMEIASLGIKTNHMEYVLELSEKIVLPNGNILHPVLLQYDVDCPYRINDAVFIDYSELDKYITKWHNGTKWECKYLSAAEILVRNLRILHENNVLHNAITLHNYTWSLELVDFELACSPNRPYDTEEEQRHVLDLFPREIVGTYGIIVYIAGVLKEHVDYTHVEKIFEDYGFTLKDYKLKNYE